MKNLIFALLFSFVVLHLKSQNVGINTPNPQEQLHLRSDSTKIALRLDNKKTAAGGFDFFTVSGTPSAAQNFVFNQYYQNWTDLDHNKLIQSDDNRLNSPLLQLSQYSNVLRVQFAMQSTIPSNAVITDVTLHAEMRRNGNFDGPLIISNIALTKASNLQPLTIFGYHYITNTTDLNFSLSQYYASAITSDILNLSDFFIAIGPLVSNVSGQSRLEIDRLWLEVEYKLPAQGTQNVYWTAGAQDGSFKITNSTNLNSNQYLTIDETGITQLKGLKISKNAGSGKVLTSNDEGKAFWSTLPDPEIETLWINKNDTAFYNKGAVQINNDAGESAIIFDKGDGRINNGNNMLETNRRLMHITLDADNNQTNEMFSIYKDSTGYLGLEPAVRFNLGGNSSWINGGGNLGVGTISPQVKLSAIGAVRASNDSTETEYVEIKHGGSNGIINTVGDGRLYFQHDNSTKMSITDEGKVGIGFLNPIEQLDVNGAINIGNTTNANPEAGTIRWNPATSDFEGFDGNEWKSLTKCGSTTQNNNTGMPNTTPACCEEQHTGSTSGEESFFGGRVAIYGSYAAILDFTDKIFIFKYDNGVWAEDTILHYTNIPTTGYRRIDMSENNIILGLREFTGSIYIFNRNSNNVWSQQLFLESPNGMGGDFFGGSVAITDDYFLVSGVNRFYIYEKNNNTWNQVGDFSTGSSEPSVSIYNETLAIRKSSTIDVYEKYNNFWGITQTITPSNGATSQSKIDIYGDYIILGELSIPNNIGSAYIFKKNNNNVWEETNILLASDNHPGSPQAFGIDVSIWGDYAIIGSLADITDNDNRGKAYIFHYNGTTWEEIEILTDPIGNDNGHYGGSVSTDGINRIAGSAGASINGVIGQGKVIFGPVD
ncbi:MAG: hypothetical protein IPM42_11905 [Saprospiraceae bacterium]|nr:hypothetical protein [Saprospiraceae bacterium]